MPDIRIPPHSAEAEQAIISAMLINSACIIPIQSIIKPDDFYRESHRHIVRILFSLKEKASLITLSQDLSDCGILEEVGGMHYLGALSDAISTSAGWRYHVEILKELAQRRRIISSCLSAQDKAFGSTDLEETLSYLKGEIRDIQADKRSFYRENKEIVKEVYNDIGARSSNKNIFVGIRTGFFNIDDKISGLEPKTTSYLIARPSMGKTALALNIADNVAFSNQGKVIFFSLESGDMALTRRRLAAYSGIYLSRLRTGDIADSQWSFLTEACDKLSENNLLIIDNPKFKSIESLVSLSETLAMESPISLIIIDHIQRMRTAKKTQSRHLEISHISEELTNLSKNLNIPILILCQLSRGIESRSKQDQFPRLSDMKESGDLESNADNVWGLWRKDRDQSMTRLEGLKGRDIGTWRTWLKFDQYIQKFYDADNDYYEETLKEQNGSWQDE